MKTFLNFINEADAAPPLMGGDPMGGGAPPGFPGGDPGAGGGMGGMGGGMPMGGGAGAPMGGGAAPSGVQPTKQLEPSDVWSVLKKLLKGEKINKEVDPEKKK